MKDSKSKPRKARPLIGWREYLEIPKWGITRIKAKIDTGARTSALHAYDLEFVADKGRQMVRFKVHPVQKDKRTTVEAEAELVDRRWVRNSGGQRELRPVVRTEVQLGEHRWRIDITLTSRDAMGFRMLLGRSAVKNRFWVAPGKSFLLSERRTGSQDESP